MKTSRVQVCFMEMTLLGCLGIDKLIFVDVHVYDVERICLKTCILIPILKVDCDNYLYSLGALQISRQSNVNVQNCSRSTSRLVRTTVHKLSKLNFIAVLIYSVLQFL